MTKLFGSRIQSLREYRGWSQSDLERESGVTQATISRLESGTSSNVSVLILARLADTLQTSIDFLMDRTDNPSLTPSANSPAMRDPLFTELDSLWPDLTDDFKRLMVEFARKDKAYNLRMRQQEHPDHSNHF